MRSVLFAATAALVSAGELKFTAPQGGTATIVWDGTNLSVPQHCREDTCSTIAQGQTAQAEVNAQFQQQINSLQSMVHALHDDLGALRRQHDAEHQSIQSSVAANANSIQGNDAGLGALEAAYKAADQKLTSSIATVTKMQGPKGDKGDQGDQGIQGEKGEKGEEGPAPPAPTPAPCGWETAFYNTNGIADMRVDPEIAQHSFSKMRVTMGNSAQRIVIPEAGLDTINKMFAKSFIPTGFETDTYKLVGHSGTDGFYLMNDHDIGAYGCSATCVGRQTSFYGTPKGLFAFAHQGSGNWGDYGTCCASNQGMTGNTKHVPVSMEINTC